MKEANRLKSIGADCFLFCQNCLEHLSAVLLSPTSVTARTELVLNKNRGAVVNRVLKKRGLSAKRDSPALQQIYEKRSI